MNTFTLPDNYEIACTAEKTRYGFRHLAYLLKNGQEIARDKACYYNRTWEAFEFQTVAHGAIDKYFDGDNAQEYKQIVNKQGREGVDSMFRNVGLLAKLGDVFGNTTEEKNKWKKRMLGSGLTGLDFPEDFDELPESEKESRLNKVIDYALDKGE